MGYYSDLAIDAPCAVCGGEGAHERGCPHDDLTAAEIEEYEHDRIEERHVAAAFPDEREVTTQPAEHTTADH